MADLLDGRDWDYVVGSVHFVGDGAVDYDDYDIWGGGELAREGVAALLRDGSARRRRAGCSTSWPTPTSSRCWGPRAPVARAGDLRRYYEPAIEGIAESASPSRSPRPGCASRSARSTRRGRSWRWWSTPATRSRCPATRTRPTSSASRYDEALELLEDLGVTRAGRVRAARAAAGADRMTATTGIGCDTHRLRGRAPADPRRRRDPARARPGRPLRRRRAHARDHRRAAGRRRRWATSASTSPTPTSATRDADSMAAAAHGGRRRSPSAGWSSRTSTPPSCMERPKLAPSPRRDPRRAGRRPRRGRAVNVKATTGEGMGFVGRGEGVAALAVATLHSG